MTPHACNGNAPVNMKEKYVSVQAIKRGHEYSKSKCSSGSVLEWKCARVEVCSSGSVLEGECSRVQVCSSVSSNASVFECKRQKLEIFFNRSDGWSVYALKHTLAMQLKCVQVSVSSSVSGFARLSLCIHSYLCTHKYVRV